MSHKDNPCKSHEAHEGMCKITKEKTWERNTSESISHLTSNSGLRSGISVMPGKSGLVCLYCAFWKGGLHSRFWRRNKVLTSCIITRQSHAWPKSLELQNNPCAEIRLSWKHGDVSLSSPNAVSLFSLFSLFQRFQRKQDPDEVTHSLEVPVSLLAVKGWCFGCLMHRELLF